MGSRLDKETNVQKHNSSHHKHGIHQVNLDDTNKICPRSHIFKQAVNKNCVDLKSRCSFSSAAARHSLCLLLFSGSGVVLTCSWGCPCLGIRLLGSAEEDSFPSLGPLGLSILQ